MNVGDIVQVQEYPDKWFKVTQLAFDGKILGLDDVTHDPQIQIFIRKRQQMINEAVTKTQRIAERAMARLNG